MFKKLKRKLRVRKYVKQRRAGIIQMRDVPAEYFDEVFAYEKN